MASFKMVLNGSEKATVRSKQENKPKLDWFLGEIKKVENLATTKFYIKFYLANKKVKEVFLSQKDIDELSLKWISYKKDVSK